MINPLGDSYICEIQGEKKAYLIQVNKRNQESSIDDVIKKTISQIINTASDQAIVTINQNKEGEWTYKLGEGESINLVNQEGIDNIEVKIQNISDATFATKAKSRKKHATEMLAKVPGGGLPFIRQLWKTVLFPLSIIIRCACPDRVYDTSTLSLKENPFARFALEDALSDVLEISGKDGQIKQSFQPGLELARSWRAKKSDHDQLAEGATRMILDLPDGKCFSLPAGYSNEGAFFPSLWTFQKKDNQLLLMQMTYGSTQEEAQTMYVIENPDQARIHQLITRLLDMSNEKILISSLSTVEKEVSDHEEGFKEKLSAVMNKIVNNSEADAEIIEGLIKQTITTAGGERLALNYEEGHGSSFGKVLQDPVKIIEKSILEAFPDSNFSDKTLFTFAMLQNRTAKILKASPDMPQTQRLYWLNLLESEYLKLERLLEKQERSWDAVKGCFVELCDAAAACREQEAQNANHLTLLDTVKPEKSDLLINPLAISSIEGQKRTGRVISLSTPQLALIRETQDLLANAEGAVDNLQAITDNMTELLGALDGFLDNRQYEVAMQLAHMLMPLLPGLPTSLPADGFWGALENVDGLNSQSIRERSEQIQSLSDQYARLSKYFWEAKIQTKEPGLRPDEAIFMVEMGANFRQVLSTRKALLENIPPDKRTYEEKAIVQMGLQSIFDLSDRLNEVLTYPYFRFFEHPVLGEKIRALSAYGKLLSSCDESQRDSNGEDIVSQLNKISEKTPATSIPKNLQVNWPSPSKKSVPYVPNVFSHISLHNIYFSTFLSFNNAYEYNWFLGMSHSGWECMDLLSQHRLSISPLKWIFLMFPTLN